MVNAAATPGPPHLFASPPVPSVGVSDRSDGDSAPGEGLTQAAAKRCSECQTVGRIRAIRLPPSRRAAGASWSVVPLGSERMNGVAAPDVRDAIHALALETWLE